MKRCLADGSMQGPLRRDAEATEACAARLVWRLGVGTKRWRCWWLKVIGSCLYVSITSRRDYGKRATIAEKLARRLTLEQAGGPCIQRRVTSAHFMHPSCLTCVFVRARARVAAWRVRMHKTQFCGGGTGEASKGPEERVKHSGTELDIG